MQGTADPLLLHAEISIEDITPHPDAGFPEISEPATGNVTNIKVVFDLPTKDKTTIDLRVFANDDFSKILAVEKKRYYPTFRFQSGFAHISRLNSQKYFRRGYYSHFGRLFKSGKFQKYFHRIC